jgi:hypothetical protein
MAEPFLSEIRIMSFVFAPKGWAFCNGQVLRLIRTRPCFRSWERHTAATARFRRSFNRTRFSRSHEFLLGFFTWRQRACDDALHISARISHVGRLPARAGGCRGKTARDRTRSRDGARAAHAGRVGHGASSPIALRSSAACASRLGDSTATACPTSSRPRGRAAGRTCACGRR